MVRECILDFLFECSDQVLLVNVVAARIGVVVGDVVGSSSQASAPCQHATTC